MTKEDAGNFCENQSSIARLVEIQSVEENNFVVMLIRNESEVYKSSCEAWLGLQFTNNTLLWDRGIPPNDNYNASSKWVNEDRPGTRDSSNTSLDCVIIYAQDATWKASLCEEPKLTDIVCQTGKCSIS